MEAVSPSQGPQQQPEPALKRSLSLPLLTLYGLGTTVGAGIYVLVGKVAEQAGSHTPLAFLLAALLAGLTAFTFAELGSRYPRSAGEAVYVREGLGLKKLALLVGFAVVASGVISAAAISVGAAGYLEAALDWPRLWAIPAIVLLLALLAAWGIAESVTAAAIFTLLEIGGLGLVIWAGLPALATLEDRLPDLLWPGGTLAWGGVAAGAFLAFYAFIGFEDMVNVAEEVKDVERSLPLAIILTLVVTTLLYLAVCIVAVLILPIDELAASKAPLTDIYVRAGGSAAPLSAIAIVATLNGALIQIIMAARVLYGLSREGGLPAALGRVNPWSRTPLLATALVALVVLLLAWATPIEHLAGATSMVALAIFALVNLALLRLKLRRPLAPAPFSVPLAVPLCGFLASAGFLLFSAQRLWAG